VRDVAKPFRVARYACADGWALATDGHKLSVYEQHGRRLNDSNGNRWLRVGVGAPPLVGARIDFALPRSLLNRLAREIDVPIPAARPEPTATQLLQRTPWQRAPVTVHLRPGDSYSTSGLYDGRPKLLTVTITHSSGTSVTRFRWHNGSWVRT
jgi:hypothetical protein